MHERKKRKIEVTASRSLVGKTRDLPESLSL
jgi:hypothetical protein